MAEVKIRLATIADLSSIVDMQIEFELYFQKLDNFNYEISRKERENDILDLNFSDNPILTTLIAEVDNEIAGRVSFSKGYSADTPPYRNYYLSGLYVKPVYRGSKISEKLFEELKEMGRKENIKTIIWRVWEPNNPAVKFYEKLGAKYFKDNQEQFMFLTY